MDERGTERLSDNRIGTREICKLCYQINTVGFHVPDHIWEAVVPPEVRTRVVCLACFTRLADEKLIPWDCQIEFFPVSLFSHLRQEQGESSAECERLSVESTLPERVNREFWQDWLAAQVAAHLRLGSETWSTP